MDLIGSVIIALITGGLSLIGVVITNKTSNDRTLHQFEVSQAVTSEKLAEMNKKLEQHNNLVSRMYAVEKDVAVIKEHLEDK